MTVHTTSNKMRYTGNGSARVWSYSFPCADEDWLHLYLTQNGVTTEVTNNYSVDILDRTVTYPVSGAALTSAQKLTIIREVPLEQTLDLVNQGTIEAEALESEFDELVQMIQQLEEKISRCVIAGVDEDSPTYDYDAIREAAALAQEMATLAQTATRRANTAAAAAEAVAIQATNATTGANAAKQAANTAASAARAVADAVNTYTERAELAALRADSDATEVRSNVVKAHEYFCLVWGVTWPFIRWFMIMPILDGKCSRVFAKDPPALIVDGGDTTTLADDTIGIFDGRDSDPLHWYVMNPMLQKLAASLTQLKGLLADADVAANSLSLAVSAAEDVITATENAIAQAEDYLAEMQELANAAAESATQACCCARKSCRAAARAMHAAETAAAEIAETMGNVVLNASIEDDELTVEHLNGDKETYETPGKLKSGTIYTSSVTAANKANISLGEMTFTADDVGTWIINCGCRWSTSSGLGQRKLFLGLTQDNSVSLGDRYADARPGAAVITQSTVKFVLDVTGPVTIYLNQYQSSGDAMTVDKVYYDAYRMNWGEAK